MKNSVLHFLLPALTALMAFGIQAASVDNGTGYTNDFSVRPAASDWATRAIGSTGMAGSGEVTTIAAMDAAAMTNTAALINTHPASATGVPPNNAAAAVWSTNGFLQLRPTQTARSLCARFLRADSFR